METPSTWACACCMGVHTDSGVHRVVCGGCGLAAESGNGWGGTYSASGRCGKCGAIVSGTGSPIRGRLLIRCRSCRRATDLPARGQWRFDTTAGVYGGLDLWLRTEVAGHVLWAFDSDHIDRLEQYVAATLRERTPNWNTSFASRLPAWAKDRKHREVVLAACERLREVSR